ncbi:MAG TPA: PIN domain-containing protein [Steroidobacter sp.]|uniref:PIN domain-containing protein n=1 Tax=Steroidobacter sp. TaxID=1978227 RepID=UPI002EDA4AB3
MKLVVFPDTNVLFHCKPLADLPWHEHGDVDLVHVLIGAPVQDEVDRHKQDGNSRRAKRARDANALFRRMLAQADETPLVIRERNPTVQISFAPSLPVTRPRLDTLDLTRADDRLLEEVIHFGRGDPAACVLTDDTGMQLKAKRHGVRVVPVGPNWRLAPETDERDKQIQLLTTELARLRSAHPVLALRVNDQDAATVGSIAATLPCYPPLAEHTVVELTRAVKTRYPIATDFGEQPPPQSEFDDLVKNTIIAQLRTWEPPTSDSIKAYETSYAEWLTATSRKFERLHVRLNAAGRVIPVRFQLRNVGLCPADGLQLKVTAHAGIKMLASHADAVPAMIRQLRGLDGVITLNKPPQAPKGQYTAARWAHTLERATSIIPGNPIGTSLLRPRVVPGRHDFYRQDKDSVGSSCVFGVEELRHGADAESFSLWLFVPADIAPARSHLYFRVSARNLPDALQKRVRLDLTYERHDTLAIAKRWRLRDH